LNLAHRRGLPDLRATATVLNFARPTGIQLSGSSKGFRLRDRASSADALFMDFAGLLGGFLSENLSSPIGLKLYHSRAFDNLGRSSSRQLLKLQFVVSLLDRSHPILIRPDPS
jgi:hypothetical protein